jgi:hypothetical protein
VLGRSRGGHTCSYVRAIVAMLHAILLILTRMIDIVFEFSPFSLCMKGFDRVLRSSHAVIPRRSLNAHVDTCIIQQMQRYKIDEHFAFIAGLRCHIVKASKRSMQYVILAGGAKLWMLNARKVTRSKYEHVSACSLQCLHKQPSIGHGCGSSAIAAKKSLKRDRHFQCVMLLNMYTLHS